MNHDEAVRQKAIQKVDFRELLEPRMRKILVLGVVLAVLQQWCGINCIFYYADKVFGAAGYEPGGVLQNVVVMGSVNFLFTLIAIAAVDRVGRKILMLIGNAGLAIFFALLAAACLAERPGQAGAGVDRGGHGLLLLDARPDHVGDPLGDLPEPHPRRGDVGFGVCAVAGLLCAAQLFPIVSETNLAGPYLGFRRDLCLRLFLRPGPAARNQGQEPEQIEREFVD